MNSQNDKIGKCIGEMCEETKVSGHEAQKLTGRNKQDPLKAT